MTLNIRTLSTRSPGNWRNVLRENCQLFATAAISAGRGAGLISRSPAGALVHREPVTTGCITFFTTYSPMASPISVPTRVEKR